MSYPTMVTIPISLDARVTPNSRAHWRTKHKIQREMLNATYSSMQATGPHDALHNAPLPLTLHYVIGLAKHRKAMDDDNAKAGLKYIQDGIARYLGIDDKHITVGTVDQVRDPDGRGFVRVLITPAEHDGSAT